MTTRPSIRLASLLGSWLVVHLLVLLVLAAQLPSAHAHASSDTHTAHPAAPGDASLPQDAWFDLTPPEVRTLGGPTLVEVLEAPPMLGAPEPLDVVDELRPITSSPAPDEHLGAARLGRAPPVA